MPTLTRCVSEGRQAFLLRLGLRLMVGRKGVGSRFSEKDSRPLFAVFGAWHFCLPILPTTHFSSSHKLVHEILLLAKALGLQVLLMPH